MADRVIAAVEGQGEPAPRPLPEPAVAREWLESMLLIRRFEERAGEMYAKAKVGGFLHLAIGEEATIVGAARAMRHSAVTDLPRKGESFGVPGLRCDGMDVVDTHAVVSEALRVAREERRPTLVEAVTYRFRGHSMADPEEYRTKEQVETWRRRDPIATFAERLVAEGLLGADERDDLDRRAQARVDAAVAFADASPFPEAASLYDDVY